MKLKRIISGGQTGADMGGLRAAMKLLIPTGGWAPQKFWTENGSNYNLIDYGLKECDVFGYLHRTLLNIVESDGTVIFSPNLSSAGTKKTIELCRLNLRPYCVNPHREEFIKFLEDNNIITLNVAGNRESVSPGVEEKTCKFIYEALYEL